MAVPHTDAKAPFDGNEPLREVSAMRNSSLQGAYFILAARALGWIPAQCRAFRTMRSMLPSSPTPRG